MYWSYILTAVGILGVFVMAERKRWGWLIGVAAQILWFTYGLVTDQYGFLISSLFYAGAYSRGFANFNKKSKAEKDRQLDAAMLAREFHKGRMIGLSDAAEVVNVRGQHEGLRLISKEILIEREKSGRGKPEEVE